MKLNKKSLLIAALKFFARCRTTTRLRWGRALGHLTPWLLRSRAHIVQVNLAKCFPELGARERQALARRHFNLLAQSFVDRGLCWYGSPERIRDTVTLTGAEHLQSLLDQGKRILMFAPHFIGLDAAATRLTLFLQESATLYSRQSDADVDAIMRAGRSRFNKVHMISRQDGVRGLIRQLLRGIPVYYLPDMDFGRQGSAFIPFFGVPAATLLSAAQIASNWDVAIVPIISRLDLQSGRYLVEIGPPLADFPGADDQIAATTRLNALIEAAVRQDPAQYYWVHRRFKTRPAGESGFY